MNPADIVLAFCLAGMVVCVLLLIRNSWVGNRRLEMIDSDFKKFQRLEGYDAMLWRWWCWDVEKFVRPEE